MEDVAKRGKGRPTNEALRTLVKKLAEQGFGYNRSVPFLIEAGYVDAEGNCTVTEGNFGYMRKIVADNREFKIKVNAEQYAWAKEHHDEIAAYIQMRMAQDK